MEALVCRVQALADIPVTFSPDQVADQQDQQHGEGKKTEHRRRQLREGSVRSERKAPTEQALRRAPDFFVDSYQDAVLFSFLADECTGSIVRSNYYF
ncbi:MAG: hypothetical protein GY798_18360 [Hyphomicrobiales bacterium]|nr:hypothetical protein [Hyphomicrobiales bacterium]